jgi:hypothetical protein
MFGRKARRRRIAEAEAAIARTERLRPFIDMLVAEAREVGEWAQERYEHNHLTELFNAGRRP